MPKGRNKGRATPQRRESTGKQYTVPQRRKNKAYTDRHITEAGYRKKAAVPKPKITEQRIIIYPDFVESIRTEFPPEQMEELIDLHERGFVYAYEGNERKLRIGYQFIPGNFDLYDPETSSGNLHIIANVSFTKRMAPSEVPQYVKRYLTPNLRRYDVNPIENRFALKVNPEDSPQTKHNKIVAYMNKYMNYLDRHAIFLNLIGFYFD